LTVIFTGIIELHGGTRKGKGRSLKKVTVTPRVPTLGANSVIAIVREPYIVHYSL